MSALEEQFAEVVRRVIREELRGLLSDRPEELLDAGDVASLLGVNIQKVYSLARQGQLKAIWLSKREMRFAPSAIREFQLNSGTRAA